MQITDTPNNTKFVYLYVNSFQWSNPVDIESAVGHPKPGQVYRAILNTDTKSYRLFYDVEGDLRGAYLSHLISPQGEDPNEIAYTSDIIEITKQNILGLKLNDSQLAEMLKWIKEDNESIREFMNLPPPNENGQRDPGASLNADQVLEHINNAKDQAEFAELGTYLATLMKGDPVMFSALSEFIYSVGDKDERSAIDTSWPSFSPVLGAGKNISKALEAIARYGGDDRRINLDPEDLTLAMNCLLDELTRRQYQ